MPHIFPIVMAALLLLLTACKSSERTPDNSVRTLASAATGAEQDKSWDRGFDIQRPGIVGVLGPARPTITARVKFPNSTSTAGMLEPYTHLTVPEPELAGASVNHKYTIQLYEASSDTPVKPYAVFKPVANGYWSKTLQQKTGTTLPSDVKPIDEDISTASLVLENSNHQYYSLAAELVVFKDTSGTAVRSRCFARLDFEKPWTTEYSENVEGSVLIDVDFGPP
jgi:hypothetical protein